MTETTDNESVLPNKTNDKIKKTEQRRQPPERVKPERTGKDTNIIYIGGKPFMNYVTGVTMQFTTKNQNEVVIKSRGKFISRAVDVAEVVTKRFLKDMNVKVKNILIDSDSFKNQEGKDIRVSTIEIVLSK